MNALRLGGWCFVRRKKAQKQQMASGDFALAHCLAADSEKTLYRRMKACFLDSMDPNEHQGILIKVAIERYQSIALLELIKQFGGNLDLPIHQGMTALQWVVSDCICQRKKITEGGHWEKKMIEYLINANVDLDLPIDASHLDLQGLNGKSVRELLKQECFDGHL